MAHTTEQPAGFSEEAAKLAEGAAHRVRHEGPDRNDYQSEVLRTAVSSAGSASAAAKKTSGHLSRINAELEYTENALRGIASHMSSNLDRILSPRPESDSKDMDGHEPNSDLGVIIERVGKINNLIGHITDQTKRLEEI